MRRAALLLAVGLVWLPSTEPDWPQFRGPDGTGRADAASVPLTWSEDQHVTWKTAIHGKGWSSPVILDNQIWLTTATADGRELSALALDRASGRILRDLKLFTVDTPQFIHTFNSPASPTPVLERGRAYVTFGSPGTAAIDTATGKVVWQRRDLACNHFRGAGSSPIVYRDLLIMHFDGSDVQYVVALDKKTGRTVWKTDRSIDFKDLGPDGKPQADGDFRKAFATPVIARFGGRDVLISLGSKAAYAYEPMTGKELWRVEERAQYSASTRPLVANGTIYWLTGWSKGQLLALRPDATGHATEADIAWRVARGAPNKPSLLLVDGLLYMLNDTGIVSAVDATTGEVVWTSRIQGEYSASPLYAARRIYFFSEDGRTTVIEPGRQFKVLAESHLGDGFMGSAAVDGNALILRSRTHLYRVE
jgi:outer membrane protein assembly factor BamB